MNAGPCNVDELEELLSRPDDRVFAALEKCPGDVTVLGAGGKMGPSLCRMLQRAVNKMGDGRRVIGVSRFAGVEEPSFALPGIAGSHKICAERCDLTRPEEVYALTPTPNVIFMAGQKFGTSADPSATWAMNASVPTLVAQRFRDARMVVFSTGNVYPMVDPGSGGAREDDDVSPVGEYAASCLARERIFSYYSRQYRTEALLLRLNYAVDLRYGVLVDLAVKVNSGQPVDVSMGHVNVIWQGDANAIAIAALGHCRQGPPPLNVTGAATLSVRKVTEELGALLGRSPKFTGREQKGALLSNSARMQSLFGAPRVDEKQLTRWVAAWVKQGGELLARPTHFEERGGRF
jgi:nucleoside-diphosphate-sugar epimerase